jgi:hypothetical protein
MQALDLIAAMGGGAEGVLAYLALARHATVKGPEGGKLTSAGAHVIQKRIGLTHSRAEAALEWLQKCDAKMSQGSARLIMSADEARQRFGNNAVPLHFGYGKSIGRHTKARWWLAPFGRELYLANALVDGVGAGKTSPPLARLYSQVNPDIAAGLTMANARLDAAMLIMNLYRIHLLEECGGVDPRSGIYREWGLATTPTELEFGSREPVCALNSGDMALYEVQVASENVSPSFMASALAYVPDDSERNKRLWCAVCNLKRLGLIYEVLTVWNGNPFETGNAELEYTLYVFDRHARESEPYLQREIHTMGMSLGVLDYYSDFLDPDDSGAPTLLTSGRFRLLAHRKTGAYPVGVFRLRFRANTRDTGIGIEAERQRCLRWANLCRQLGGKPPMSSWTQPSGSGRTSITLEDQAVAPRP